MSQKDIQDLERNPITSNTKHHFKVTSSDLPLSCPMPDLQVWNLHPRVFLPIEDEGHSVCPYCGANYILINNE